MPTATIYLISVRWAASSPRRRPTPLANSLSLTTALAASDGTPARRFRPRTSRGRILRGTHQRSDDAESIREVFPTGRVFGPPLPLRRKNPGSTCPEGRRHARDEAGVRGGPGTAEGVQGPEHRSRHH